MRNNRRIIIVAAVLLQCLALAAIGLQREWTLRQGETVYMRTVPVDPRDLFRGDYVRLNYEVSTLPASMVPPTEAAAMQHPQRRVYLSYQLDRQGVLQPLRLSLAKPAQGRFVRGLTRKDWRQDAVAVRYGVEKYFVQQGRGLALEQGRRLEDIRIPLEMSVAVGRSTGIAVLKGFRHADMGMGLVLPQARELEKGASFNVTVRLVNASEQPLAIVDPPDHRTFEIELFPAPSSGRQSLLRFEQTLQDRTRFDLADVKVIMPGAVHEVVMALDQPRYRLRRGDQPIAWQEMTFAERARIVYRAPRPQTVPSWSDHPAIWQGQVVSRSFSGRRLVD